MDKNEAINNIKDQLKKLMLFAAEAPVAPAKEEAKPEEKKMESLNTKDGLKLSIEGEVKVGAPVVCLDAEGKEIPTENKPYELENGQTIVVKDGLIDSISESPATEPSVESPATTAVEETPNEKDTPFVFSPTEMAKPEEAPVATDKPTEEKAPETSTNPIEDRVAAIEGQISQILEILQGLGNSQEMAMSKLKEFSAEPAEPSIQLGKSPIASKGSVGDVNEEMKQLKALQSKLNQTASYSFKASK